MKKCAYVKNMKIGDLVSCHYDDDLGIITDSYDVVERGEAKAVVTVLWSKFRVATAEIIDDGGIDLINSA